MRCFRFPSQNLKKHRTRSRSGLTEEGVAKEPGLPKNLEKTLFFQGFRSRASTFEPPTNRPSHNLPNQAPNYILSKFEWVVPSSWAQSLCPKPTHQPPKTSNKPTKTTTNYQQPANQLPTTNQPKNNQPTNRPTNQQPTNQYRASQNPRTKNRSSVGPAGCAEHLNPAAAAQPCVFRAKRVPVGFEAP